MMRRIERDNTGLMLPGQDLVAAGYAGLAGTVQIAREKREQLEEWFSGAYIDQIMEQEAVVKMALSWNDSRVWEAFGAAEWEPLGEGGIFTALWNLSGAYGMGITFSLKRIPLRQETVEICERYDLNPYRLWSAGGFLLAAGNGGDLVRSLESEGMNAAVIGKVTGGIKRIIDRGESFGYLERPLEDEIYKVLSRDNILPAQEDTVSER